jgi:flagellar basal body-associated protein FliL
MINQFQEKNNMIKKQQKWIALLVTLTFVWLLQVSAMPLAAAGTTEQVSSANAEQGPNFVEAIGQNVSPAKKKSILPIILIGVGVVAIAAVLFLVVLKTNYDITGEWTLNYTMPGWPLSTYPLTCTGDKKAGTAATNLINGDYTVDGKKVTINLRQNTARWEYIGEFKTKVRMEGDFKYYENNVLKPQYNGTFYADKK